jgi:hypothetical protein
MAKLSSVVGFDQWQNVSTNIVERGMQSENGRWDPATVIGLKSSDRVLVVGNAAFLPWLPPVFDKSEHNLVSVRKVSEIETLLHEGQHFDKIILARETAYSHDHVLRAGAFGAQLVYFPQDDGWQFEQSVEFYYPGVRTWKFDSTFGQVIIAEPHGASWRVIHG